MDHPALIVFTDLDGSLLNWDYTYEEAQPALKRLREYRIPIVLASSKTASEMRPLADELQLTSALICENGGIVCWPEDSQFEPKQTILGTPRAQILKLLNDLHARYQFRSFENLGIQGIIETTGLTEPAARRAAQRQTNEPLLWDDDERRLPEFQQEIEEAGLTLTRGGRFWHVAGTVNKGVGLQMVMDSIATDKHLSVAIGDSPIDLPMLELSDIAIIIPGQDGSPQIQLDHPQQRIASAPGATGWNSVMQQLLDSLTFA